jgi:hypothetical protein
MTGAGFFFPLEGEMSAKPTEGVASEGISLRLSVAGATSSPAFGRILPSGGRERPSTAAPTPPGRFAATLPSRGRESADA